MSTNGNQMNTVKCIFLASSKPESFCFRKSLYIFAALQGIDITLKASLMVVIIVPIPNLHEVLRG